MVDKSKRTTNSLEYIKVEKSRKGIAVELSATAVNATAMLVAAAHAIAKRLGLTADSVLSAAYNASKEINLVEEELDED